MEEWFQSTSYATPLHFLDVIVYNGTTFNPFLEESKFQEEHKTSFDFSEVTSRSIGALYSENGGSASAFVVSVPSNLKATDGRKIKALLLTAAHVFTNPLQANSSEMFFTLAPDYTKEIAQKEYTKFKVHRIFAFSPYNSSEPQIDPVNGNRYMLPDDIEVVMIIENDPMTIQRARGNELIALKYEKLSKERGDCFIIGYPGICLENQTKVWAPITSKRKDLEIQTKDFRERVGLKRLFAPGKLVEQNRSCAAVTCSTWVGMSGGPVCQVSEHRDALTFGGVYNGSAALQFQELIGRTLSLLKGYPVTISDEDIPVLKAEDTKEINNYIFFAKALHQTFNAIQGTSFEEISYRCNGAIRLVLSQAEDNNINVEHNLAITGGDRFNTIISALEEIEKVGALDLVDTFFKNFEPYKQTSIEMNLINEVIEKLYHEMFYKNYQLLDQARLFLQNMGPANTASLANVKVEYERIQELLCKYLKDFRKEHEKIASMIKI